MFKKTISNWLTKHHYWRQGSLDELSELYISLLFRGLAVSLTGLFVPLYLVRLGYGFGAVLWVFAWMFTARIISDMLAANTVAKLGPKHGLLIGYALQIVSSGMFLTLHYTHWPLWLLGVVWGSALSFFIIPFEVDFSKVKHSEHGGKEYSFVTITEKIGGLIGPLVGGLIATIFGAQYTFLAAFLVLVIGVIPLFSSDEPVRVNQRLDFHGLKKPNIKREVLPFMATGVENVISILLWPLYLGVFVLRSDALAYTNLGILSAVSVLGSIAAARIFGKMIDNHRGRQLLRTSAGINAVVHLFRPFIGSYPAALGANIVNDSVTVGYRLPFYKYFFDAADAHPGFRIVYISSMEWLSSVAKASVWWLLFMLTSFSSSHAVASAGFILAAAASLIITLEKFKTLRRPSETAAV